MRDSKSTYTNQFNKLKDEIKKARKEANDNHLYLKTLSGPFNKLEGNETNIEDLVKNDLFDRIMYTILLIWKNNTYYKSASRLVVLIREICNAIIQKANNYIDSGTLLDLIGSETDASTACEKLEVAIDVCTKFKDTYYKYKSMSDNSWRFP